VKSLANQKVVVAFPHGHEWSARFGKCLWRLGLYDSAHHHRIMGDLFNSSGANIVNARNEIVERFLDAHDADWLWFVDTDMTFEPDILDRMVKAAHPEKRPILGALCFSLQDGMRAAPTIYVLRDDGKVGRVFKYPFEKLIQVHATGTGSLLIHRSVLEAMRERWERPYQWFQEQAVGGLPVGEDITFCIRAGAQGFPVFVDTSIRCGHEKPFLVDESMYAAQQESLQAADLPVYVVVPFKDRLDLTAQLIESLEGYARLLLFDNGSESPPPEEWSSIPAAGMNIHQMWNAGVEAALAESGGRCNIAILNNDIKVNRGFLDQLARTLRFDDRMVAVCPNYDGRDFDADIQVVQGICANRYDGTGGLAGFAFMVKGEWFEAGYRFPEELAWWFGDNDFVCTVAKAGGALGLVKHVHCEHIGGGGQTARPADFDERIRADREWFQAKWAAA
jgi:GT2 family glycosyltransferase